MDEIIWSQLLGETAAEVLTVSVTCLWIGFPLLPCGLREMSLDVGDQIRKKHVTESFSSFVYEAVAHGEVQCNSVCLQPIRRGNICLSASGRFSELL